jgi:PAS domain-containing protein
LALRNRELQLAQERLLRILESNADAIVVIDREAVVRLANSAAESLFGCSRPSTPTGSDGARPRSRPVRDETSNSANKARPWPAIVSSVRRPTPSSDQQPISTTCARA